MAIAEYPTASGPAFDYVLFIDLMPVAVVKPSAKTLMFQQPWYKQRDTAVTFH
ncbi:MAG: hypothetical protein U0Z26_18575 [Anaerolineales bacterium]